MCVLINNFVDKIFFFRFDLYNKTYDAIKTCKSCTNSLEIFRTCMLDVRNTMATILDTWDVKIPSYLAEIKKEAEQKCLTEI